MSGRRDVPGFYSWQTMHRRCSNKTHHMYKNYGGRGITVCEQWKSFDAFIADMGARPTPGHSIDRIDNDGNYEPGNCRWSTQQEQNLNTRTNHRIEAFGKRMTLSEWSRETGISRGTIQERLKYGWTQEQAVTRAKRPRGRTSRARNPVQTETKR